MKETLLSPLDIAVKEILEPENPYAYSTLTAIERYLRQFHLEKFTEPAEILALAYLRGREALRNGKQINNPHAWLKGTAVNIIREQQRSSQRFRVMDADCLDLIASAAAERAAFELSDLSGQLSALWRALATLAEDDPAAAELLHLRFIEQLSWAAIRSYLDAQNGDRPSDTALRQRICRAKKRLRRLYHTCEAQA
ncbi:RNA polymerase sigma factor [Almyronema epifaneia]|uniref:RNA polymerase sigma factor n=1 Tax=Almyronema epifaneia S1 TaxID=2991925 RepID=A0ABW6IGX1_9CYAN